MQHRRTFVWSTLVHSSPFSSLDFFQDFFQVLFSESIIFLFCVFRVILSNIHQLHHHSQRLYIHIYILYSLDLRLVKNHVLYHLQLHSIITPSSFLWEEDKSEYFIHGVTPGTERINIEDCKNNCRNLGISFKIPWWVDLLLFCFLSWSSLTTSQKATGCQWNTMQRSGLCAQS